MRVLVAFFTALLLHVFAAPTDLSSFFIDIQSSQGVKYDQKDNAGEQMASLHVRDCMDKSSCGGANYWGLYHAQVGSEFQVRLAASNDLQTWIFVRTLLANADMPYPFVVNNNWILVAHEQWMNSGSREPSRLGFRLYYNESQMFAGISFNTFVAPSSLSNLEGTPSIFDAWITVRSGYQTVDAAIGFHYNDKRGVDQNGVSTLLSFGPTVLRPSWQPSSADNYNQAFSKAGVQGNLGQRDSASKGFGSFPPFSVQEGNIGPMPPTIWADWRVWLYVWSAAEIGQRYTDGTGTITPLAPSTAQGSSAFGNPSFSVVKCPSQTQSCLFVSYFLFSEGAKPGEAGACTFYNYI